MIPAIDLLPPCLWVKWSEWVSEKWSVFGPLFFLELIYIIDHIYTFIATRGKCAQQLSYGSKVRDKLGSWLKNFQKHPRGEGFWKNGLQLVDPRGCFWGQISGIIFFFAPKKFLRDLPYKIEGEFDFWWKRIWKFLQVIYLEKTKSMGIPYVCEWVSEKVIHFWSFNFFVFGCVKGRVLGNNDICIKSPEQLSYGR